MGVWDNIRQYMHIVHFKQGETFNSKKKRHAKVQIFGALISY